MALGPMAVLLLLFLVGWAAGNGCPPEFEHMCDCGLVPRGPDKRLTYVTSCVNAGFDNTMMLRKLPPQTEVLEFTGNEVKDLPLNIFGQETVYDKLKTIDFSNNHIQSIKGKTFHNVANVTKLVLDDNDLYIVSKDHHPRMFSNFVNLRELHLRNAFTEKVKSGDYLNNLAEIFEGSSLLNLRVLNMENNEISSIHSGEFCSLPSLERLYLADNHLADIPLNFTCLRNLQTLDVGNNHIPSLGDQSIASLEKTKHLSINLTANPFKCDCHLIRTFEWMHTTLLTLVNRDHLYCYDGFPPNIGKPVTSVDLSELQCLPVLSKREYHTSATFVVLTIGFVCLAAVLVVLAYKNRVTIGVHARRVFQPIRSKFNYVSLERRDGTDSMEV